MIWMVNDQCPAGFKNLSVMKSGILYFFFLLLLCGFCFFQQSWTIFSQWNILVFHVVKIEANEFKKTGNNREDAVGVFCLGFSGPISTWTFPIFKIIV